MPIPTGAEIFFDGVPIAGVNAVQRLTITGLPTGGTFQIVRAGQTTAAISYIATAAQVQAALEGLAGIEVGEVACSGGQLPANFVDIRFQNALGGLPQTLMTTVDAFTGGTTPASAITSQTTGVRGTYRGAAFGAILLDTINGVIYEQTGTSAATPTWSEVEID